MTLFGVKWTFLRLALMLSASFGASFCFADSWLNEAYSGDSRLQQTRAEAERMIKESGDETVLRLYQYKVAVEDSAYQTTMNLCLAYRIAAGYGPIPGHPYNSLTGQAGAYTMSLLAWQAIVNDGFLLPFKLMGGLKADYNSTINARWPGDFNSWAKSLHVIYLIESLGFLQGAVHCLNTLDHKEISRFASAVIVVDLEATLAAEVGLFYSGTKVAQLIVRAASWTFKPIRYFLSPISHLLGQVKARLLKKSYMVVIGGVALPIAGANFNEYMRRLDDLKKMSNEAVAQMTSESELSFQLKFMAAYKAYKMMNACVDCDPKALELDLVDLIDDTLLAGLSSDFEAFQRSPPLDENEKNYHALLTVVVPYFNKTNFKNNSINKEKLK